MLGTFGATSLVFGISEGPELGWRSVSVITALVLALVLLTAFLVVERRATNPLLPFKLFADRDRVVTFAAIFFSGAALFCTTVYVALFVQDILGYSPLRAGMAFIPFAVGLGVGSALASKIVMRIAPRWLAATGALIMVVGLFYGSTLDGTADYLTNLFVPIIGIGFGVGLAVVPLPLCAVAGVAETEIGPLTAITQVAQTLSGPLALAVVGRWRRRRRSRSAATADRLPR